MDSISQLLTSRRAEGRANIGRGALGISLVIHGLLHVLGHDHQEAEEAQVMKSREQALLEAG